MVKMAVSADRGVVIHPPGEMLQDNSPRAASRAWGATLSVWARRASPVRRGEVVQEGLRLVEIGGVEAFGEPLVDAGEGVVRLVGSPAVTIKRARLEAGLSGTIDRDCRPREA